MKQIFRVIMCVALFAGLPAFADWDKGVEAHKKGDYETALREWKPLAEQGDASAQNNLGAMYENGEGVSQNYQKALKWYRLSAEQGHAVAQQGLAGIYHWGRGVPEDYKKAAKWYILAAQQGEKKAQNNLGGMYYHGHGVPQDYIIAHMWFNLAVSNGSEYGIKGRDLVAKEMTPEQIAEAQKLARECVKKNYKGC